MKKRTIAASLLLLATIILSADAFASGSFKLSPALDVISQKSGMTKTGLLFCDVRFTKEDFKAALGTEPASVTFTSLPPATDGALYLSSTPVSVNQTITAANLDLLRFVPTADVRETAFRFTTGGAYSLACVIKLTGGVNRSPVAGSGASAPVSVVTTQRDVTCFGTLTGSDPDGDPISYVVTKYPEHGLLKIIDASTGEFSYTPFAGTGGADTVRYRVFDDYGNYSDEASVTIRVGKRVSDVELADMTGHWGENAAITAVYEKAMTTRRKGGALLFEPEAVMTREDFLVTCMKSLGAGPLSPTKTDFYDDAAISDEASGYVAAAARIGIISGESLGGITVFRPKDAITRAEAAVILNRIIGDRRESSLPSASDRGSVPVWAEKDVSIMLDAGIMNRSDGLIDPGGGITRAEAAQMVYNIKNLYLS
ncbi:MAG: S-layer homology domain-containing protein [Clostridia bacterium]|nr:S-layer homology domain-containing protein [Clostridia bacterium]